MSLVISVVQENYIVATSDTAVTKFFYDSDHYEKTGEIVRVKGMMEETGLKSEKVSKLSNNCLLLATGTTFLTSVFRTEMELVCNNEDDLLSIREKARKVINNLRQGIITHFKEVMSELEKQQILEQRATDLNWNELTSCKKINKMVWKDIDDPFNFNAFIVGFDNNGQSGMVDVVKDDINRLKGKAYPALIIGEHPGYSEDKDTFSSYQKGLILPPEHRTIDNFIQASILVHAQISKGRVNISNDCNVCLLTKNGNDIDFNKMSVDTTPIQEQLQS